MAMFTGKKGIAVAASYAAISFVVSSLAPAVDKLRAIDKLSIFHYYNNPQIMQHSLSGQSIVILCTVSSLLMLIGWVGFTRRNIQ
jgi:putative exporter of polyketide antibiotics